jgi:HTH-type transcriptional regulator / antitoxin HigA
MSEKEYKTKNSRMEELLKTLTSDGVLASDLATELDLLSDEIADYEDKKYPFKADTLVEMIELRMFQRKLKQKDIAQILGTTPSRISEILNGKRNLTMDLAKGLYQKLNIDADLILSE